VLNYASLERLARHEHSSLLGPFIIYEKMKSCDYAPRSLPESAPLLGRLLALPANIGPGWKSYSVFSPLVNYDHKKFHNIGLCGLNFTKAGCLDDENVSV
jgi:hypothetical protein